MKIETFTKATPIIEKLKFIESYSNHLNEMRTLVKEGYFSHFVLCLTDSAKAGHRSNVMYGSYLKDTMFTTKEIHEVICDYMEKKMQEYKTELQASLEKL